MAKILVVDDDPKIRNLICRFLSQKDHQMESAKDGASALAIFEQFNPDLVILDTTLPDADACTLCQEMQNQTNISVLLLTSPTDNANRLQECTRWASDSMTKPFSLGELEVRVETLLHRQRVVTESDQPCLTFENLIIDPVRREVRLNDETVPLTDLEFDLIYFAAKNPTRVRRRIEQIQEVWDYEYVGNYQVMDIRIGQIFRILGINTNRSINPYSTSDDDDPEPA